MAYRFGSSSFYTLLYELSKNELKSRYSGNYGGILWAFVHPVCTIAIFWFVFSVGFKSAPIQETPFILWLIAGIIPWFFFSEAINETSMSVLESHFLFKKIVFDIRLLPLVKAVSALCIHFFFVMMMMCLYCFYGYFPTIYWIQLLYYIVANCILILGLGYLGSAIVVFFKDIRHLISMGLQFGFWLTPIFWTLSLLPEAYWSFFKLNPMYYITQGFRDSLIEKVWFWEKPVETIVFWSISLCLLWSGKRLFETLKPHFADVI